MHVQPALIAPASEWECASHFAGGVLKASRGLRPHFPGQVTDRTRNRHRLGQRTLRPEPVVVLQPWAFILMKEANHDEDIAKTRAASHSENPRNLSALQKAKAASKSHPLVPEMSCGDATPTPPSPRTAAIDLDATTSSMAEEGILSL